MDFEWDAAKALENRRKHGLSFKEASALFVSEVDYLEIFDAEHSQDEDRFIAIGPIRQGLIVVVWTDRDDGKIRMISARMASHRETEWFHEKQRGLI